MAKRIFLIILGAMLFCSNARAGDGFGDVRCGTDIASALTGKHMSDGSVMAIAQRHKDLGLKNLWGSNGEPPIMESWRICGKEYVFLLDKRDVIRDVVLLPQHSQDSPEFIGICKFADGKTSDIVIAILDNKMRYRPSLDKKDEKYLPAKNAWKMDEKSKKFVPIEAGDIRCPLSGINSTDGGL